MKAVTHMIAILALASSLVACQQGKPKPTPPVAAPALQDGQFTNPIIPNGADPWLQFYNGNYYLTTTTWTSQLVMRKSPTLAGLANATPINIWSESAADRCCNFWAFEFHRLMTPKGYRWYVMYTSGTKDNFDGQHLSVIESEGDDPMGPYTYKGSPMPKSWNIDGTYLQVNGQLYLLWSEWQKDEQLLWAAKMANPWTIVGEKKIISRPTHDWEQSGMKVNEGPEVLQKNGKTFIVFSASFCNTPDYKLGVMELTGTDPLADNAWHKMNKPFFEKANGVFGPGHNGFFKSPDGKEDWLVYHGNATAEQGCGMTRSLRAQKFDWQDTGEQLLPHFGQPVAAGQAIAAPSGENCPLVTQVQGTPVQLVSQLDQLCLSSGQGNVASSDCRDESSRWTLDYTSDGRYRLVNSQGLFLTEEANNLYSVKPWRNARNQQWVLSTAEPAPGEPSAFTRITNAQSQQALHNASWRIQPLGAQVISSTQSGKVVSVAMNAAKKVIVELDEWHQAPAQRWQWVPVEQGFYTLQNQQHQCIAAAEKSIVPGTALVVGECNDKSAHWTVEFLPNGTQKISQRISGLVFDVSSCGVANHTPLAQAPYLNTICQQFHLLPVGRE